LKECLANDYSVVLFEAESQCGGQWRYTEPNTKAGNVHSSVYHGIILNSCRDTSEFCDFPLDPEQYPQYFGHAAFLKYLEEYSCSFNLDNYIRYNTKVLKCEQMREGTWKVDYEQNGAIRTDIYKAVFACTGHLWNPNIPKFDGLSDFKGESIHSHVYRTPAPYEGKKVAVIGFGSSGTAIQKHV
jgi:dimethylaniline monooxygenase (N-oxide forming)